ncbi:SGNH/GDSL hydrolase family protein [Spirosoma sp. BT702]|uniref:SGNH/GDSL hydrolase family protein n=1 Tax=Spirosoma profusum TaxID=2771354 RepID=A0A926Y1Z8_9BACT|nr:SGNH/GDSL hydrolase family protein [Spirosoma profusum]MBD2700416.1 SGNH/GDSL hydrolase family protein [Spirosoma profusum]
MRAKLTSGTIRLVLLGFLTFMLYFGDHFSVSLDYPTKTLLDNIYVRLIKCSLLILLAIELTRLYYYGIVKNPKSPKIVTNVLTLFLPLVLLTFALEMAFMFIEQSQEGGLTLASHIWFERHWKPVTPDNYRDSIRTDTAGKKKVLVVGDSFAAGHGIETVDQRFGDILGHKLGKQYVTYNLGRLGSETGDEFRRLAEFKVKPNVLVLQYFPNDIEKVARDYGVIPAAFAPYTDLPRVVQPFFRKSYLLNFIYWQFPHGNFKPFDNYARKAYGTDAITKAHLAELNQFIDYAHKYNSPLYVVMFPFMNNVEKSAEYTAPVANFFREKNIPVLEVSKFIGDLSPAERVVGKNDGHASALVNQRVGENLFKLIQSDSLFRHVVVQNK